VAVSQQVCAAEPAAHISAYISLIVITLLISRWALLLERI
jgi:hypothetical protein